MKTYSLAPSELTLAKRIRKELAVLLYLQLIILVFFGLTFTLELSLMVVYLLLMSLKPRRIVYQINIQDKEQYVELRYYFLIFFNRKLSIPFSELNTQSLYKRQGLGSAIETLEFSRGKVLQAEIRLGGPWKWEESLFRGITSHMDTIRQKA